MMGKGANPKKSIGIPMSKFEYRPVAPKNTKATTSNDKTKEASKSRQPTMAPKVMNTSNAFGFLSDLDEGSNVNVKPLVRSVQAT